MLFAFLCFSSLSLAQSGVYSQLYTIEDLKILADQKNYKEFIQHAKDIRPSKRDKAWREMLTNMANEMALDSIKKGIYTNETFDKLFHMATWPVLKDDVFFRERRIKYGLNFLKNCQIDNLNSKGSRAACLKRAKLIWTRSNQDAELAFKLAKQVLLFEPEADLTEYVQVIAHSKVSEFYCDKDFIGHQLIQTLRSQIKMTTKADSVKKIVDSTMNEQCFSKVKQSLVPLLTTHTRSLSIFSYQILSAKKSLSQNTSDLFLMKFVLDGPVNGDIFNQAWNMINKIGSDYDRRMSLLTALKELDPLPGKLFQGPDKERVAIILTHLTKNFPEYTDHFARTCLNFLNGIGSYPTGNPTVECPELFDIAKNRPWVEQGLQMRYSSIKK